MIQAASKELKINLNILEAGDGIEILNLIYSSTTKGISINYIISDDNMNFMNGSNCADIVQNIVRRKGIKEIPFYLLTAYENKQATQSIRAVIQKPVSKQMLISLMESSLSS